MEENEKEGRESKRAQPRAREGGKTQTGTERERETLRRWKNELVEWGKNIG